MKSTTENPFMRRAIDLVLQKMNEGHGGPFGAVVVKNNEIIGEGYNSVLSLKDPTAHAEILAIRNACRKLGDWQLKGCEVYTSCEPCPMCLGALYWARVDRIYFACNRQDAAEIGFDDAKIYGELTKSFSERLIPTANIMRSQALEAFHTWRLKEDKTLY